MNPDVNPPHRIKVRDWMADNGFESIEELGDVLFDSVQPAMCSDGCEVEPDGKCPHGFPSISLALGII